MKKIISIILATWAYCSVVAQAPDYNHLSLQPNADFYTIRNATQHYYDSTGLDTVQGSGYKQFKRWESFWTTRVGDNSNAGSFQNTFESFAAFATNPNLCSGGTYNEQWQFIGHNTTETSNSGPNWGRGQGILIKVYVDMVHDASGNTIYAGSNSGGLWRTRNAKSTNPTWVCLTNQRFPGMGVNEIAIDPNNSNIMYISTGLGMGDGPTYGMGILKTTNGQSDNPTWNVTGLTYDLNNPSNFIFTQGVFLSPSSNTTVFALMKNEIYKSTDGGATFTKKYTLSGGNRFFRDLVFLPANSSTIFVSSNDANKDDGGAVVLKSNDNGETWSNITSSLGFSSIRERIDLAVTAANSTLILAGGGSPSSYEISKSTNSGVNWTKSNSTINAISYLNGGYWENDIVISPDNEDIVYLALTGLCKSTNGGASFNQLYGYWAGIVHPDVRGLYIRKDGVGNDIVYLANDGGLNVTENSGTSFKNLNGTGLAITQIYGFDLNLKKDWIAIGTQDLGFYNSDNGTWKNHTYGDGIRMIFNPFESTETMYGQTNGDGLNLSNNRGASWNGYLNGSDVTGSWERKMTFDALGNFYIGNGKNLYRKNYVSNNFLSVGSFPNAIHRIWGIGVSKSNPNVVYVGFDEPTWSGGYPSNRLYKSTNALDQTPTWTDISANIPVNWMGISDIVVDPNNSEHVWVITGTRFTNGGSTTADRVHFSSNGGNTFITINQGLNINSTSPVRFPINIAVLDEASGGMYLGTDIGVYYNPNPKSSTSAWVCFNKDMPTAIVTDLKIDYCSRKILASTFGRGLWESNLAEAPKSDYVLTSTQLLNVNQGETRIFYSDITIPSGQTFTVKGLVKMAPNRKITIKPGAKILIDGGRITSTCDLSWAGIRVEGYSNIPQFPLTNQGFVQMINNATVENAHNAISLIGLSPSGGVDWSKTGGLVQATNSNFVNNRRDVEFMSYHPKSSTGVELPNRSFFKNCRFTTNRDNKIPNNQLTAHVTMWDVNGVQFQGCVFEDLRTTPIIPKVNGRTGIYTINSTYTVGSYCTNPLQIPCSGIPSQFNNLKSAIQSYNNGTRGIISIENSQFNSYKGAFLQGTTGSTVRSNTFTIGHDVVIPGLTDYPYGLYLDKCQRFNTEGNQFTGTTGAANVANGGAAGLVIRNTGPTNNDFYRSNFDNLKMASQALSENRDVTLTDGLIFRCNDYEQTWNDLDVRNDPNNPATNGGYLGMKELQGQNAGGPPTTPDNLFANSSSILNFNIENRGNYMQYVYTGPTTQANRLYPFDVTSNVLPLQFSGSPSGCPNRMNTWGMEREPVVIKLSDLKPVMMVKRNQVKGLTDGGNTTGLKNSILNANGSNVGTVVSQLLGFSPHLSNEVLALLAMQDIPFTHEMIRDVMLANPHSARCLWVQENLDASSNPLPQAYRDQINSQVNVYTKRDTLGAELSALTEDYDLTLHELLYSYEVDSNATLSDYAGWMKHPSNPTYHYQLAEKYFDQGDWTNFVLVKDSILLKLQLNDRQIAYHTSFSALFEELYNWQLSGSPIYEPDSNRMVWLLNFANTHTEYPARIHALLAVNDTYINQADVYIPDETGGNAPAMALSIETLEQENKESLINLYPNPAQTFITLEWKTEAQPAYVSVTNLQGKTIAQQAWNGTEKCNIVTENWPNGVYFVRITTTNNTTVVRKVIINK
jgi:hypothetical protein